MNLQTRNVAAPTSWPDRIGRGLLVLVTLSTFLAFADGVRCMSVVSNDRLWVEGWRTFAFLVLGGMCALLAAGPRAQRGVWERLLGHKIALVVFAAVVGNIPEARPAGFVDLGLVVTVGLAYVLCRGWDGWRSRPSTSRVRIDASLIFLLSEKIYSQIMRSGLSTRRSAFAWKSLSGPVQQSRAALEGR